jgi:PEP-CTERM motif
MKIKHSLFGYLLAGALFITCQHAEANPVTWDIDGTFADGGTIVGDLVYDADIFAAVSWNLTVSNGNTSQFPVLTYTSADSTFEDGGDFGATDLWDFAFGGTFDRYLSLGFVPNLTNAGGVADLLVADQDTYESAGNFSFLRDISGGTATAEANATAPEPATFALLGIAGLALGWKRARRITPEA